jgi:hypothetical protein
MTMRLSQKQVAVSKSTFCVSVQYSLTLCEYCSNVPENKNLGVCRMGGLMGSNRNAFFQPDV